MRALRLALAFVIVVGLAGCGSTQKVMPNVVDLRLDIALSDIERAGVKDKVEVLGGGVFGVVDKSNWQVCDQEPAAGQVVTVAPRLTVDRSCDDAAAEPSEEPSEDPTQTPSEEGTPSAEPTRAETSFKNITVDRLLDKLNSAKMGGIKVGDQFRLTGELFMSEMWMTGASGDFFVMLKAKGGAQDLTVFVDESDADEWEDGTKVEMVVEMVEATINDETTDGWLKARSTKTIS